MELDPATRAKFDAVLARVKEPVSELSLAELNLVSKIRYSPKEKALVVRLEGRPVGHECPACSAMNGQILVTIERTLKEELQKEFPGFTVEYE
ncbi:MAG: hypothetical protein GX430_14910 [Treponema sp.]|nr:hypothetical protein [Treponema sp.]